MMSRMNIVIKAANTDYMKTVGKDVKKHCQCSFKRRK